MSDANLRIHANDANKNENSDAKTPMLIYEFMQIMQKKLIRKRPLCDVSQHSHGCSHFSHRSKGFALLFAVLATSVLLAISASIWNIALREIILSSYGRESQVAFYVADSAIECALYWDFNGSVVFATSSDTITYPPSFRTTQITCTNPAVWVTTEFPLSYDQLNATSSFWTTIGGGCATVLVGKSNPGGLSHSATNIVSYGNNTVCDSLDPTTVERGLRVTY